MTYYSLSSSGPDRCQTQPHAKDREDPKGSFLQGDFLMHPFRNLKGGKIQFRAQRTQTEKKRETNNNMGLRKTQAKQQTKQTKQANQPNNKAASTNKFRARRSRTSRAYVTASREWRGEDSGARGVVLVRCYRCGQSTS